MVMPDAMRRINKAGPNKVLIHLGGHGAFARVEHVGRRSGTVRQTPVNAFRHGDVFTLALTYGPRTDWLRNLEAAGGGRLLFKGEWHRVGAPRPLTTEEGMARMPLLPRLILPLTGTREFVELPVLRDDRT
ncbi:conserved hypothetical protein [Nostocoides japonicum T1-X7]|uniref:Deazaflavin-dependent nitroreductase family protein n=1 Tax=Nostocoides japonicum T1-X7 TaxID=1194083 RepID=A0A077LTU3_9MICO|nr:nitroreductase family deazaflavin-dependent oxidoreductase [Tetrasphaera japonica]CCH76791.1 conserved hypothetical protein [Tetrasphaera japonica T1-X7]